MKKIAIFAFAISICVSAKAQERAVPEVSVPGLIPLSGSEMPRPIEMPALPAAVAAPSSISAAAPAPAPVAARIAALADSGRTALQAVARTVKAFAAARKSGEGGALQAASSGFFDHSADAGERARLESVLAKVGPGGPGRPPRSVRGLKKALWKAYKTKFAAVPGFAGMVPRAAREEVVHYNHPPFYEDRVVPVKVNGVTVFFDSHEALRAAWNSVESGPLEGLEEHGRVYLQVTKKAKAELWAEIAKSRRPSPGYRHGSQLGDGL